jgi:putative endopeptidase
MTLHISSRLMATAALGALMLAAVPATAKEKAAPATATEASAKPEIGDFGFDLTGMDKSVQPGDDFYTYANGTWAKNTQIPADKSNYGMFTALADLSQKRTREILDVAKGDPNSMIGRAYSSYLDAPAVEAKGLDPIQPWLTRVRAVDKAGLAKLLSEADRSGIQHFFGGYSSVAMSARTIKTRTSISTRCSRAASACPTAIFI